MLWLSLPTSSLSSAWMKRGRANPTWANSVIRTRYSELLNFGALSFLSISRMVKVVNTVASDGNRSSFNSVALDFERKEEGQRKTIFGDFSGQHSIQGLSAIYLLDQKVDDQTQGNNKNRHKGRTMSTCRFIHPHTNRASASSSVCCALSTKIVKLFILVLHTTINISITT